MNFILNILHAQNTVLEKDERSLHWKPNNLLKQQNDKEEIKSICFV
jgi:hypothetical protein